MLVRRRRIFSGAKNTIVYGARGCFSCLPGIALALAVRPSRSGPNCETSRAASERSNCNLPTRYPQGKHKDGRTAKTTKNKTQTAQFQPEQGYTPACLMGNCSFQCYVAGRFVFRGPTSQFIFKQHRQLWRLALLVSSLDGTQKRNLVQTWRAPLKVRHLPSTGGKFSKERGGVNAETKLKTRSPG